MARSSMGTSPTTTTGGSHATCRQHVPDPRRGHAGARWPGGGHRGRVRPRRLADPLRRRGHGPDRSAAASPPPGLLLGRKTYEIFAGHWPQVTDERRPGGNEAQRPAEVRRSTTLDSPSGATRRCSPPTWPARRRLKAGGEGELSVQGSGDLLQTLPAEGLVDEYRLWACPVVLGRGKRLFGSGSPALRPRAGGDARQQQGRGLLRLPDGRAPGDRVLRRARSRLRRRRREGRRGRGEDR